MNDLRTLPLSSLLLSQTAAQLERRAHFDQGKLAELAESIKQVGLLSPLVARPMYASAPFTDLGERYQLVAGERRLLAAQLAGLTEIPVSVRELTDEQVLEVQLVENLQREDLHELAEAEGYEALQQLGHSVEEIAGKVGKSKATVYARCKLLALGPDARRHFRSGDISASIALLLARIPDHDTQLEALAEITDNRGYDEPMSYRDAQQYIHQEYTFRLDQAGFDPEDLTLCAPAGGCSACPKRSGSQPELFSDITRADVCTDPVCFRGKREAHGQRLVEQARTRGQRVIEGEQAKRIAAYGANNLQDGFVSLDQLCSDDPKYRSYRKVIGKQLDPVLVVDAKSGAVIEAVEKKEVAKLLKDRGVEPAGNPTRTAEKKAKAERAFREALYSQIRAKFPARLAREELEGIALAYYNRLWHEVQKRIDKLWGWDKDVMNPGKYVPEMTDAELSRFLLDCSLTDELLVSPYGAEKSQRLIDWAKRLKIDPDKLRKELAAAKPAKASRAPAKKKAAKKAARKAK